MRAHGAASVLGLDLSENMIAHARADTPDDAIEYRIADLMAGISRRHRRMLGTTLNLLTDAGFAILRVEEFAPSSEQIAQSPSLAEERERPMMALLSAQRHP